jgi:hypothetical protein
MAAPFIVNGSNAAALFTLKVYRGESMVLLAMNWKTATPPMISSASASNTKSPAATNSLPEEQAGVHAAVGKVVANTLSTMCVAHPEVPLGAFSAQRRAPRRVHIPRHPRVHERAG